MMCLSWVARLLACCSIGWWQVVHVWLCRGSGVSEITLSFSATVTCLGMMPAGCVRSCDLRGGVFSGAQLMWMVAWSAVLRGGYLCWSAVQVVALVPLVACWGVIALCGCGVDSE